MNRKNPAGIPDIYEKYRNPQGFSYKRWKNFSFLLFFYLESIQCLFFTC